MDNEQKIWNFLKEKGYDFDEELTKLKENPLEYTKNLK